MVVAAQDPYLNHNTVNTSDLFGTARFVGMGGAIGALGGDISTISSNPAGIAFFSKNGLSLTAGASWQGHNSTRGMATSTFAQFDQIGGVATFKLQSNSVRSLNFAFNYQKKASYDNSFFGETYTAASWADQLDALAKEAEDNRGVLYGNPDTYYNTLYGLARKCGIFPWNFDGDRYRSIVKSACDPNSTLQMTRGSLNAYEINLSMNVSDRYFWGITIGVDNMNYRRFTDYWEQRTATNGDIHDFGYVNEQHISGNGYNIKLGAIIRPFDSSTFRFGVTLETPTWYFLKYVDNQGLTTKYDWNGSQYVYVPAKGKYYTHNVFDQSGTDINYLEYSLVTPWKVRAQMGSTVSSFFAWGVEYEFANYPGTTMKYPAEYGGYNKDQGFIDMTKEILKPQHILRMGMELKASKAVSLRAGYNYITSTTRTNAEWDPFFSDDALSYPTGLDYMNLSDVHILTLGAGYRHKWFYADLSYKYRYQRGEY